MKNKITLPNWYKDENHFVKEMRKKVGRKYKIRVEKDSLGTHIYFDEKMKQTQSPKESSRASE